MRLALVLLLVTTLATAGSMDRSYGSAINATALSEAYQENEVAADGKYQGARVSVSGTVAKIGKDQDGDPYVLLHGANGHSVRCKFSESNSPAVARIRVGSAIGIKGTVVGVKADQVTIKDCSL